MLFYCPQLNRISPKKVQSDTNIHENRFFFADSILSSPPPPHLEAENNVPDNLQSPRSHEANILEQFSPVIAAPQNVCPSPKSEEILEPFQNDVAYPSEPIEILRPVLFPSSNATPITFSPPKGQLLQRLLSPIKNESNLAKLSMPSISPSEKIGVSVPSVLSATETFNRPVSLDLLRNDFTLTSSESSASKRREEWSQENSTTSPGSFISPRNNNNKIDLSVQLKTEESPIFDSSHRNDSRSSWPKQVSPPVNVSVPPQDFSPRSESCQRTSVSPGVPTSPKIEPYNRASLLSSPKLAQPLRIEPIQRSLVSSRVPKGDLYRKPSQSPATIPLQSSEPILSPKSESLQRLSMSPRVSLSPRSGMIQSPRTSTSPGALTSPRNEYFQQSPISPRVHSSPRREMIQAHRTSVSPRAQTSPRSESYQRSTISPRVPPPPEVILSPRNELVRRSPVSPRVLSSPRSEFFHRSPVSPRVFSSPKSEVILSPRNELVRRSPVSPRVLSSPRSEFFHRSPVSPRVFSSPKSEVTLSPRNESTVSPRVFASPRIEPAFSPRSVPSPRVFPRSEYSPSKLFTSRPFSFSANVYSGGQYSEHEESLALDLTTNPAKKVGIFSILLPKIFVTPYIRLRVYI